MENPIHVQTTVNAPLATVWECWNGAEHIPGWSFASDDWGAKAVENNLTVGGTLTNTLFAKDGSMSFDFTAVYTEVVPMQHLAFTLGDNRCVTVDFTETPEGIVVSERFEAENTHSREMQEQGWQAFLNNFKKYVESL